MGELVDPADLVGAHEIAERLDVSRSQVVHVWRKRHADFFPDAHRDPRQAAAVRWLTNDDAVLHGAAALGRLQDNDDEESAHSSAHGHPAAHAGASQHAQHTPQAHSSLPPIPQKSRAVCA